MFDGMMCLIVAVRCILAVIVCVMVLIGRCCVTTVLVSGRRSCVTLIAFVILQNNYLTLARCRATNCKMNMSKFTYFLNMQILSQLVFMIDRRLRYLLFDSPCCILSHAPDRDLDPDSCDRARRDRDDVPPARRCNTAR